jgi:hypothetical protein
MVESSFMTRPSEFHEDKPVRLEVIKEGEQSEL